MDYRRPLFQLEQWSPYLARKIWGLTSLLDSPLNVTLGLKVKAISDLYVEVALPLTRLTRDEQGAMGSSAILAAGEFASKVLWHRHLSPSTEQIALSSIHCRFLKAALTGVRGRVELNETERENVLRKLRAGHAADVEMAVIFIDDKDQQVASLNCVWQFRATRPLALGRRNKTT